MGSVDIDLTAKIVPLGQHGEIRVFALISKTKLTGWPEIMDITPVFWSAWKPRLLPS
jgi:hypothetical protein